MTSGLPTKMGADDFICRFDEDAFRCLVNQAMQPPPKPRPLEDYRHELARIRCESVGNPGVYLDTSPTGSGKTTADIPAVAAAETSLTILPTHKHCGDVQEAYTQFGLNAEAYPQLNKNTCHNLDEATWAIDAGLSASTAVCPTCTFAHQCEYRSLLEAAEGAAHRIATHQRARMGLLTMAEGRRIIMIHENPVQPTPAAGRNGRRVGASGRSRQGGKRFRTRPQRYGPLSVLLADGGQSPLAFRTAIAGQRHNTS